MKSTLHTLSRGNVRGPVRGRGSRALIQTGEQPSEWDMCCNWINADGISTCTRSPGAVPKPVPGSVSGAMFFDPFRVYL